MEYLHVLPHVNASLNALSFLLLVAGIYFIKTGNKERHRLCMLSAASVSALFLVFYLLHHTIRTYYFGLGPTKFTGEGTARTVYFFILSTHTVLAALVAPMIVITLLKGIKGNFDSHKKIARFTYPIWLYVSVTGVLVYLFLYHLYRAA
jgi:uncharacterized membrane protein YozB (DUF420 family)